MPPEYPSFPCTLKFAIEIQKTSSDWRSGFAEHPRIHIPLLFWEVPMKPMAQTFQSFSYIGKFQLLLWYLRFRSPHQLCISFKQCSVKALLSLEICRIIESCSLKLHLLKNWTFALAAVLTQGAFQGRVRKTGFRDLIHFLSGFYEVFSCVSKADRGPHTPLHRRVDVHSSVLHLLL